METSRRRPVRKTQKNLQLSNLESVVENESSFEFGFDSASPKIRDTFMDWDDTDEDTDYSPPSDDDDEEYPETPATPHYDYSPLSKNEDEEFPETPQTPEPKRQQDWENPKPKTCPQNQTLGLKPLSFAPLVSFRPAAFFPVKPVSVPESTQPEEIKPLEKGKQNATALDEPTSTSESTSEELEAENTALKSEVERLKELLQQKLVDERQERQQWQEEKSSVLQEITQLKTALKDKETEVTKSKRISKKKNVQLLRQMHDLKVQHEQEHLDFTSKLEMEKRCLIKDHELALTKVQNQLAVERKNWLGEFVSLKQEMAELRIAHEEEKAAIKKSNAASIDEIFSLKYNIKALKLKHEETFKTIMDNFEKERMRLKEDHKMTLNSQMERTDEEIQRCQKENDSLLEQIDKLEGHCEKHKAALYRAQRKISELLSNSEMERLKRTIREKDAITDILKKKLEKSDHRLETITRGAFKDKTDFDREIQLLKETIEQERIKTNQAKLSFDLEVKESSKLRAALVQKELEGQQQLEEERQQLEQDRQQLEEEKSTLSQQITHLKKVVKKKKTIIRKTQEDFQVQIHQLQQQVDELKEKTPKKSVGRRFLNLFRRSRKKD